MVMFRWFSLTLIVLALMLLGADIISTLEAGSGVVVRSMDKVLLLFGVDAKPWIQATFSTAVANAFLAALASPGWATLGIIGVILALMMPARRESAPEPLHAPAEH
jgi:hypothetical protein